MTKPTLCRVCGSDEGVSELVTGENYHTGEEVASYINECPCGHTWRSQLPAFEKIKEEA